MKAMFVKTSGNSLAPADSDAELIIKKLKIGDGIVVDVKKKRNVKFHRKLFALLSFAFDIWTPDERIFDGRPVEKNKDRFREEVLILAGHFDQVFNLDGSFRLVAKSISFDKCDDHEFEQVYRGVLGVVWKNVLSSAGFESESEVEGIVNELLRYE